MKIINICNDDFANVSFENSKALQSVGVNCQSFKLRPHVFNYKEQSKIVNSLVIKKEINSADIVQVYHSCPIMYKLVKRHPRIIVYHAGSKYRNNAKYYNKLWNPIVEKTIVPLGEFYNRGGKNINYVIPPINTSEEPVYNRYDKTRIRHHPSSTYSKGSDKIIKMMREVSGDYEFITDGLKVIPNEENKKRMADCNIYIDLFKPEIKDNTYGSWGIASLEAAALGKIVVCNNLHKQLYEKNYGQCGITTANTEQEFISTMQYLVSRSQDELIELQKKTREWAVEKHSYKATGLRLKKIIFNER